MGFFNQARRSAVIQGPKKVYPKIVSGRLLFWCLDAGYRADPRFVTSLIPRLRRAKSLFRKP